MNAFTVVSVVLITICEPVRQWMLMEEKCKKYIYINTHNAAGNINIKCGFHYSPLGAVSKDEYKGRTACWEMSQVASCVGR